VKPASKFSGAGRTRCLADNTSQCVLCDLQPIEVEG